MGLQMALLIVLSTTMCLISFAAGNFAILLGLSEQRLKAVSICSTGVLIGSALAIIIPEGVETLYEEIFAQVSKTAEAGTTGPAYEHKHTSRHIGMALLAGFLLMSFVDQTSTHTHETSQFVALDNLDSMHHYNVGEGNQSSPRAPRKAISASIGLFIHSLADGIALGASSHTSTSLSIIVFLAMLLHKAPAAFSLAAILLKEKLSAKEVRSHLLAFSFAAPVGAILTSLFLSVAGESNSVSGPATGLILVFSGGTFLYVAVSHAPREMTLGSAIILMLGMLLPLLLSLILTHEH